MKVKALILFFFYFSSMQSQQFIPLWPVGKMPNTKGMKLELIEERERITQVAQPGMYAFFTSKEENNGSAVLICPPGGYAKLTYTIAGFQFAKWLNTMGINAFVLIHRLPTSPDLVEREKAPIQDAQRAMKIIRSNAVNWNINTAKIGVMGASAGGHLATTLGTHSEDYSVINDTVDQFSFQPNFMILISPVISMGKYAHKGSLNNFLGNNPTEQLIDYFSNEKHVTSTTPPTFIVLAQNDPVVNPINGILFYQAMLEHNISGSLHVFPEGGHSIALKNNPKSINLWTNLCEEWLNDLNVLDKTKAEINLSKNTFLNSNRF
ncbi:alpha/beta hydrolase [Flavobacterium sufflavum]|uniref:Alpha/beta hydrolase n=1 Tax=Flavobacterium sufflavum TaxID=1921138 RepID=A0A3S2U381_9FLAO|nr:alpha/beta hydrolase [Flavobacterium sufflavum]RVT76733.1 alpha/beta hydrolase [Flavobacterium sufflavum]